MADVGLGLGAFADGMMGGMKGAMDLQKTKAAFDASRSAQKPAGISAAQGTPTGQQAPAPVSQAQGTTTSSGSTQPVMTGAQQPAATATTANQSNMAGGLGIPAAPAQQAQSQPGSDSAWSKIRSLFTPGA